MTMATKNTFLLFILFICYAQTSFSVDNTPQSSWFSTSYITDWLKNTWLAKQVSGVKTKMTSAQEVEKKWAPLYAKKETVSKTPITQATESALKFKRVLQEAATKDPS